jgi:methionyl-tRNA formyltransferase
MKIIFAGTPDFAVPALQSLIASSYPICAVYTQPDRPSGRGRKLTPSRVKALALEAGIPVFQPTSFKHAEEIRQLESFAADLIIVVAYGMILPQIVLDIPRLGCVNIHGSLLPKWRGAAPIHRAVMAGDKKTGVTIMRLVRKLDAGDMLYKEECNIGEFETTHQLYDRMAKLGAVALAKVLPQIEQGTIEGQRQDESLVTYAEKVTKSEAELDWLQSAIVLARKIRGLNAWPVAQTKFQDKVLRIWQAEVLPVEVKAEPGIVLESADKHFDVATGKGVLRLLEIQLPGGKPISASAFLNAHSVAGVKLG